MYEKNGLTLGDLYRKCKEVLKVAPDDTPIYIVMPGGDTSYDVNRIGLTGIKQSDPDFEDKPDGCPTGLELITEETLSQNDLFKAIDDLGNDAEDFIIYYIEMRGSILGTLLERYGVGR